MANPKASPRPDEPVHSFIPRPFPPPSLNGVPLEYIIDSLRKLAPRYWNNAENVDCSIIYPLDNNRSAGLSIRDQNVSKVPRTEMLSGSHDPSGMGRRLTAPNLNSEPPRMLMRLHIDYLSAQSTLLRALFSGSSPLDLINIATQPAPATSGRPSISANVAARLPRLLPSSSDHPIVYLPVPDPPSFPYLITWMYFGDTSPLEDALRRRTIRWDGLARNVEYLGMPDEIKRFLGAWYRRWMQSGQPGNINEEDDNDDADDAPRGRSRSRSHSTSPH
ncbi:hypothetical protein BC834DRAFT_208696 [Gloeopeniophorella convolvens]|nr:hypothetical protein BC834DRAFT_208696 [Gloeopeniophorella convolvens]